MADNKLADLSTEFAVQILKLTDSIKGHYSLVNQLKRSCTSIGANIREAKYAHGKADFIAKLQIALKECSETESWLKMLLYSDVIDEQTFKTLRNLCGRIRRMLTSSCVTIEKKINNS